MPSSRRLVADLYGLGKLKVSKRHPDRYYFLAGFGSKRKRGVNYYVPLHELPLDALERFLSWIAPEYDAAMNDKPSPYGRFTWTREDEEHIRIALDLCYKELARRASLIHK